LIGVERSAVSAARRWTVVVRFYPAHARFEDPGLVQVGSPRALIHDGSFVATKHEHRSRLRVGYSDDLAALGGSLFTGDSVQIGAVVIVRAFTAPQSQKRQSKEESRTSHLGVRLEIIGVWYQIEGHGVEQFDSIRVSD
jgi:hypothetical protein